MDLLRVLRNFIVIIALNGGVRSSRRIIINSKIKSKIVEIFKVGFLNWAKMVVFDMNIGRPSSYLTGYQVRCSICTKCKSIISKMKAKGSKLMSRKDSIQLQIHQRLFLLLYSSIRYFWCAVSDIRVSNLRYTWM